jgi:DNA-directed RNA polymerase specialized sigma24 family protein
MHKSATLADDPTRDRAGYFYGVARNVVHEHLRARERQRQRLAVAVAPPEPSAEQAAEIERRHACLDDCMATELTAEERELILEYHRAGRQIPRRADLAQKAVVSAAALRKRTQRIRARLHRCVQRCLNGGD